MDNEMAKSVKTQYRIVSHCDEAAEAFTVAALLRRLQGIGFGTDQVGLTPLQTRSPTLTMPRLIWSMNPDVEKLGAQESSLEGDHIRKLTSQHTKTLKLRKYIHSVVPVANDLDVLYFDKKMGLPGLFTKSSTRMVFVGAATDDYCASIVEGHYLQKIHEVWGNNAEYVSLKFGSGGRRAPKFREAPTFIETAELCNGVAEEILRSFGPLGNHDIDWTLRQAELAHTALERHLNEGHDVLDPAEGPVPTEILRSLAPDAWEGKVLNIFAALAIAGHRIEALRAAVGLLDSAMGDLIGAAPDRVDGIPEKNLLLMRDVGQTGQNVSDGLFAPYIERAARNPESFIAGAVSLCYETSDQEWNGIIVDETALAIHALSSSKDVDDHVVAITSFVSRMGARLSHSGLRMAIEVVKQGVKELPANLTWKLIEELGPQASDVISLLKHLLP